MAKFTGLIKWAGALLLPAALLAFARPGVGAAQGESLRLILEWPNEGEVFYAGPTSLIYTLPIKGWVESEIYEVGQIELTLKIYQEGELVEHSTQNPALDNSFAFHATVNPHGSDGFFPAEHHTCGLDCHYGSGLNLPLGALTLEVTALEPRSGDRVTVTRHVTVDRSQYVEVPVEVRMADDPGQMVSGVTVSGVTWLYLWRARTASAFSDEEGIARLQVEALSAAPTYYEFQAQPTLVDGVLYEGVTVATLTLPPGATSANKLSISVRSHRGAIAGRLLNAEDLLATDVPPIWAIHLPDGAAIQTTVDSTGIFSFADIPIDSYLLTLDPLALVEAGYSARARKTDLTLDYQSEVNLAASKLTGHTLHGIITDEKGDPLPFAWPYGEGGGKTFGALPDSGKFLLFNLPDKPNTLVFSAPGYYAQRVDIDPSAGLLPPLEIRLLPQPETQRLAWGSGELIWPAETRGEVDGNAFTIERGWIWGQGDGTDPLTIHTADASFNISEGQFALEYIPGYSTWFYLFSGEATVTQAGGAPLKVAAGEMVNLSNPEGLNPAAYSPSVKAALNPADAPLAPPVWQPTEEELRQAKLKDVSLNLAQTLTMLAYILIIASLVVFPLAILYSHLKTRRQKE